MASVTLTLPWKHMASSNTRNSRRGGKGHSWQYKRARLAIELHAIDQVRGRRPLIPEQPCTATLRFYPPDARKRDVRNYAKVIFDGLQGVVYADDYQVWRDVVERMDPDREDPRCVVTIEYDDREAA